jgi:hypothetical protein
MTVSWQVRTRAGRSPVMIVPYHLVAGPETDLKYDQKGNLKRDWLDLKREISARCAPFRSLSGEGQAAIGCAEFAAAENG